MKLCVDLYSGVKESADSLHLAVDGPQLENINAHVEIIEDTVFEASETGVTMLTSPADTSDGSSNHEQQSAVMVTPIHDDSKNRIRFEYSQPLSETNRRSEPCGGEILRVSLTGSTELRPNRSLEALCDAADSELKNIGQQVASDEQLVQVKASRHSTRVASVMSSVVGSCSRLVLPAIQLNSDGTDNNPSEAVLLMQKPVVVSDNSYPSAGFCVPVTTNGVSSGISISKSVQRSYSATGSTKLSQTMQMVSSSVMQSSRRDPMSGIKQSRHTCRFCGRVCAKPSVLQKHIRTHTGERPFPCTTCGLRFKTKSNLYKHCKSRTHLYALSGSESLSADESQSSVTGRPVAEDEQPDDTVDNTVRTASDDQEEELKNPKSVSQSQLSPTFTDSQVSADVAGAGHKLLTVIDGNMYVMEQVTLPSLQPVIQQLQQGAAISFNVPLETTPASENTNVQSEELSHDLHNSVRLAVFPTAQSDLSATSDNSKVVPQINRSSVTVEALQEHITRLISENASIINTPMAEAPRAKRVLRQSSDVTASSAAKLSGGRPLLRTRSLTPCPTTLPASSQSEANDSSSLRAGSSESSHQKLLHRAASDTAAYSFAQVSGSSTAGKQFLTVPNEPHCIDDITNRVVLLPSKDGEDAVGTDIQCSEVRIVLELADSLTSAPSVTSAEGDERKKSSLNHLPILSTAVTTQSFSVNMCKSSMSSQPAEQQNPTLLPVTSLVPSFMINPVEQSTVSQTRLPVQSVKADPLTQSVPLQCVLLNNNVTMPIASHSSSFARAHNSKSMIIEVVNTQQQPRRGRPRGSKNRPKLAASASEPKGSVTARTVAVREPLSAGVMSAPTTHALWRLKLKDRLMRRSLSTEHRVSPARQHDKPASSSCESVLPHQNVSTVSLCSNVSSASKGGQLLSTSSLGTTSSVVVSTEPVVRSRSCDASVPPKKRRKTLTELGRGTAFGTRVEESVPAIDLQSNNVADTDSLSVSDDAVFYSQSQNASLVGSTVDGASSVNLFPLTNRALQIMYNSPPRASALCSSAVMHGSDTVPDSVKPQSLFIRLPTGIGSKIPGLVRRCRLALDSDSAVTVSAACTVQNSGGNAVCNRDELKVSHCSSICCDKSTAEVFTHFVSTDNSHSSSGAADAPPVAVAESGQKTVCSSVASVDETELFELPLDVNASSGTMLLLGHSYPSLGIVAEPTFCSILSTQPTCVETSGVTDGHTSMYNTWRASSSSSGTSDELVLTARDTFSLYRTSRLGKDLSYAAAPAFDSRSGGVLTHSSYWKYRTDRNGSDAGVTSTASATVDVGRAADELLMSSANSSDSTEKNGASPTAIVSEDIVLLLNQNTTSEASHGELKIATSQSTEGDVSQKRVWVFPGGYRSTESYVYVRGRGRGRYVCATCGVRCKKPSVLRKHLRSHTDVRPHHCNVCDVGFKTKGNLSKHLNSKAHHSRSSELGSISEQVESSKSLESSSYDADLDSSSELAHGSSTVDPESDSGCDLQPGSSCEVETEAVSVSHQNSSVDTDGENRDADKQSSIPGVETRKQSDANTSSGNDIETSYSQSMYVDASRPSQPFVIMTARQQRQPLSSKLKAII